MLIVTKRRYKKQHVIGGSGIFDTIINFAKRLLTSNAAKSAASAIASSAAKQAGKHVVKKMLAPPTIPEPYQPTPTLSQKSKDDLLSLIHQNAVPTANLNNLMMQGSSKGAAIKIQDLVKYRGAGKKIIY